jgi:nucleotide-binding universal stress UspA family protein
MSRFNRVLCPVDMFKNSLDAIELATNIAKQNDSKLVLMYVAPTWSGAEPMPGQNNFLSPANANRDSFQQLRPTEDSVECEHLFLSGNAGPEIVRASERCDTVVIGSHPRSASEQAFTA